MNTSLGLYYPFIHFKDENWLKLSALYFDKMFRIVPSTYVTDDSDTVKALGDFVDIVRPEGARPEFSKTFIEFIDTHEGVLVEKYGIDNVGQWGDKPSHLIPPTAGGGTGTDPRFSSVFVDKMDMALRDCLMKSRLGRFDPIDPRWFGMHPKLWCVYMTSLADELADACKLQPMTDETIDHLAISGLTTERLAQLLLQDVNLVDHRPAQDELDQAYAVLALKTILPKDMASIPAEKIAKVRERLAGERGKFQEAAVKFATDNQELAEVRDPRALHAHLQTHYDKTIAPELDKLKEALRGNDVDTVVGAMSVKIEMPALIASGLAAAGLAAAVNPVVGVAAGAALLVVKTWRARHKERRKLLAPSPASYLFRLEKELAPSALATWIGDDAKKHGWRVAAA